MFQSAMSINRPTLSDKRGFGNKDRDGNDNGNSTMGVNINFLNVDPKHILRIFGHQSNLNSKRVKLLIDAKLECVFWIASKMESNEGRQIVFADYQNSVVMNLMRLMWQSMFPQEFKEYPNELKSHLNIDPDVLYSVVMMSRGGGKTLSCCYFSAFAYIAISHFNCGHYASEEIAIKNKNQVKEFIGQIFKMCSVKHEVSIDNSKTYNCTINGSLRILVAKAATARVCILFNHHRCNRSTSRRIGRVSGVRSQKSIVGLFLSHLYCQFFFFLLYTPNVTFKLHNLLE